MQIKLSNIRREFDLHEVDKVSVRRHQTHVSIQAINLDGDLLEWEIPARNHPWDRAYVINDGGTIEVIQHKPEFLTHTSKP